MGTDYQVMQNTAEAAEEIIAKAGRLLLKGHKLSEESLSSPESAQTYAGFLRLVEETGRIARKHHFGHYEKIDELAKFDDQTWAQLLKNARFLLGIAKEFQLRLQFTKVTQNNEERSGLDDPDQNWEDNID